MKTISEFQAAPLGSNRTAKGAIPPAFAHRFHHSQSPDPEGVPEKPTFEVFTKAAAALNNV
jgi:hypothetical protein